MAITSQPTGWPFTSTYTADPKHSSVRFSVTHMSVATFSASFDDVELRVRSGEAGILVEGAVRVESVSIKGPPEFREHVVYGADFFDARTHPRISFRSDDVSLGEDGTATVRGTLTIKRITRPFTATGTYRPPVADPWGSIRTGVDLTAVIDRRDWGMDYQLPLPGGGDALGYAVQVSAQIELVTDSGCGRSSTRTFPAPPTRSEGLAHPPPAPGAPRAERGSSVPPREDGRKFGGHPRPCGGPLLAQPAGHCER
jgi:polyisoprenoid-binding protein YceI